MSEERLSLEPLSDEPAGAAAGNGGPPRPIAEVQDAIIAEMTGLEDGLERYRYLIEQGRALRVPGPDIRTEANAIPGCQARVWVSARRDDDGRLHLAADSDAMITRGIIALLLRVLDRRTPADILDADLYFLDRTGLRTHLSPARANGLAAMVERIHVNARELA